MNGFAVIRPSRRARALAQADVALEIDKSQVYVSLVERGLIAIDESGLRRILAAIQTAAERRAVGEAAKAQALKDFQNRKLQDGDR
jgi:predicted transcriptional regulator